MERAKKITGLSLLVLAQVILFVVVYLAIILLGAGLVYFVFYASIWIIPPFLENVAPSLLRFGKLGLVAIVAVSIGILGLWAFILAVGIYLIKPLFIFPKQNKNYGKELCRSDSPKLYDLIMDTAKAVGVRKPKHIYVNHEVNACVFFNTSFWNIFFPIRKNLAIGLGLFESTNEEEVRSIIAHEFGHFAQSSMRIGSVLYVANKVISDLVYRRDKLDSLMVKWSLCDGVWGFWGTVTQSVVIKIRSIIDKMYQRQQRNYLKLSRQMEYDADAVACRIVGTKTFISALCKVQQLGKSFGFYNMVIGNLANQGQIVSDYWEGYSKAYPSMLAMGMNLSSYDKREEAPEIEGAKSRVSVEEVWESHPPIEKRIEQAQLLNIDINSSQKAKTAIGLVEDSLKTSISHDLLQQVKGGNASVKTIDWNEYIDWLAQKVEISIFPNEVEVFFDRDIFVESESTMLKDENPLTDDNIRIVLEYERAMQDKHLLLLLSRGDIPVKRFLYEGKDYLVKDVPLEIHNQYISELEQKVGNIDASIRNLAITKAENKEYIMAAYRAIDYAQTIVRQIRNEFLPVREDIIKDLNSTNIAGEGDLESLREWIQSYETAIKEILEILKYPQIAPFMKHEEYAKIMSYLDASQSFITGINGEDVNIMFYVTDWIIRVHESLVRGAKMIIINTILDKKIGDVKFIERWF